MNWGLAGGIGGSLIGLLGGVIGTWCSIHNAQCEGERRLMVRYALALWAAMAVLMVMLLAGGPVLRIVGWVLFMTGLPFSILYVNRRTARCRADAAKAVPQTPPEGDATNSGHGP